MRNQDYLLVSQLFLWGRVGFFYKDNTNQSKLCDSFVWWCIP